MIYTYHVIVIIGMKADRAEILRYLIIYFQKDSVKIEPISVNKPVKDVHRNIKIYDNKIGE